MSDTMVDEPNKSETFEAAATQAIDLGNRITEQHADAEVRDVASGLLAGAVQFWLYAFQPCGDPFCDSCTDLSTAEQRLRVLMEEIRQHAQTSDYFHSPRDANVGTA